MKIRTSHVGSFPLSYSEENVVRALKDMWSINIDAPPYPQLRSFIEIYLNPLVSQGVLHRVKDVFVAEKSKLELSNVRFTGIPEAEVTIRVVKNKGLKFKWLRAPVTGAFTLASRVYLHEDFTKGISATALADKGLVKEFFAAFVKEAVKYLSNLGYNIVFIDEPSLTLVVGKKRLLFDYKEDEIIEVLDDVGKSTSSEVGIHVCGLLHRRLLELIVRVPSIKYISIELHDTPENFELIEKSLLELYDKVLSPGIVSSKKPVVEDLNDALNVLRMAYERSAGRIDLVSGDCGFRGLKSSLGDEEREYSISLEKLSVIAKAVRLFEETISRMS
ncbi:MAG: methionine synthase [Desulfurococcaceae archaeon]